MYLSNTTITSMAAEFINDSSNNCRYFISPLNSEEESWVGADRFQQNYVVLKGSTDPNLMARGDLELVVFFNEDVTEIINIVHIDEAERRFSQRVCREAAQDIEAWNGVNADNSEVAMAQILAATTVRIHYSYQEIQQVETALRELFNNGFLNFEQAESNRYRFADAVEGHESDFDESGDDPDDYRPEINTDIDRRIQVILPGFRPEGNSWRLIHQWIDATDRPTDCGGFIQVSFEPDTFGYWTRPGTLIFRALGQGLRVEIPA